MVVFERHPAVSPHSGAGKRSSSATRDARADSYLLTPKPRCEIKQEYGHYMQAQDHNFTAGSQCRVIHSSSSSSCFSTRLHEAHPFYIPHYVLMLMLSTLTYSLSVTALSSSGLW